MGLIKDCEMIQVSIAKRMRPTQPRIPIRGTLLLVGGGSPHHRHTLCIIYD
jgi:hypothetical protein